MISKDDFLVACLITVLLVFAVGGMRSVIAQKKGSAVHGCFCPDGRGNFKLK